MKKETFYLRNGKKMLCHAFRNIVKDTFGSSFLSVLDFYIKEKTGFDFSESILYVPERAYYALLEFFRDEIGCLLMWEILTKKICKDHLEAHAQAIVILECLKRGDKKAINDLLSNLLNFKQL